ncbi:hypothetical protein HL13_gp39 [Dinoroseobacter phage DFL12phi1]|uniref:Uncharacterized protein n=2 Tax=Baltimorevirus DFL12 TaxID=2169868 RepID=A0A023NHA3_9CAUD|nr:hypothetical protein HL13_gp39 [Dinoroseobacter phage DFL12phi1]AHX01000.1 hypothetical protein DFL12P1_0039 [Dinoroseobacter phage DFL12phi1]AID16860.1 hypothetical protein vBDshPR2C_45 [Dinoroseobacter phage vBDshPR2C]
MTNLELAVTIIATSLSVFWLLFFIGGLIWITVNWNRLRGMNITVEWPAIVFTPMAIGWLIYMGVTYL